jgi:thiol:disulfide interchange protein DsbA
MKKRKFLTSSAVITAASALPTSFAIAQSPVPLREGKDYRLVQPPRRPEAADGKIEVVEFFWLQCPHCRSIEPVIEDWQKKLPGDVEFRKIHVSFRGTTQQQLYYTLVAMGKDHEMVPKVFAEIQDKRNRMNKPGLVFDWAESAGLDRDLFEKTFKSFGVRTAMQRATQHMKAVGVDGVPAFVINGKYYTAPSMTGSNGSAMEVVNAMIDKERKGG